MKTIDAVADEILAREGGFVNDPDDPGGATNHGITLATLRRLGRDVDRDGRITAADVRGLSLAEAKSIILSEFTGGRASTGCLRRCSPRSSTCT